MMDLESLRELMDIEITRSREGEEGKRRDKRRQSMQVKGEGYVGMCEREY